MIEIVGIATRLPGANNKDEFWQLLKNGQCSVTETPDDRWSKFQYLHPRQKEPGKTYSFAAGVLENVWGFDPAVFGISPREAEQMDPQQRILLETTWEAIEDAGIAPSKIAGQNVGVYVGCSALDYGGQTILDPSVSTGHFMTGNTLSIVANRLSYIFDLKGPSFTVDTACSSSLVAVNEAFEALRTGKIDTAIVAGVNILASPFSFIGFAQATMLSPDGLCRAFDEKGYGYVRAEGCISIILRRSDADKWHSQRSYADIIAVDTNSDGRTVGMSLPSADDQSILLERIYRENDVNSNALAFVEAHGTGTRVGDPAEAQSIGMILAQNRTSPLPIGSVKTNIGHLEPASGLAGLVKAVLSLHNDYLPASLHFENPNPDIAFDDLRIEVVTEGRNLVRTKNQRYAGINSFGFGGTNAHVIISDPAPETSQQEPNIRNNAKLLMLSAQTENALKALAQEYASLITEKDANEFNRICQAAFHRKTKFREGLIIQSEDVSEVAAALSAFAVGDVEPQVMQATQKVSSGKCAFVFSGNGAQWPGMGRAAYNNNDIFKANFDEISILFGKHIDFSLSELLFAEDLEKQLELTSISQPLIFVIQVSLCAALSAYGLKPDMTFGHSVGEIAASVAAGKLPLADAVHLVCIRSSNQEIAAGRGTMGALALSASEALNVLKESGFSGLEIAAINSHKSVTLSGASDDIIGFAKFAQNNRIAFRAMGLNYPFHSKLIDDVKTSFKSDIGSFIGQSSEISMVSTVSGAVIDGTELDEDYWWANLRKPVNFAAAIGKACELGATSFVEIGPKPILQSYMKHETTHSGAPIAILQGLKASSNENDADPILRIVSEAMLQGITVVPDTIFGDNPKGVVDLPYYPWQHSDYYFSGTNNFHKGLTKEVENPLLGWRVDSESNVWNTHLDRFTVPFLADHAVNDHLIFPGAGFIEMMLAAALAYYGKDETIEIQTMDIISALRLSDQYLMEVQTVFNAETGSVEISSRRLNDDDVWSLNAKGRIFKAVYADLQQTTSILGPRDVVFSGREIYKRANEYGLNYGPSFQCAKLITKFNDAKYRVLLRPDQLDSKFGIHPAHLDACFHGLFALFDIEQESRRAFVPIYFDQIIQFSKEAAPEFADITIQKASSQSILADFKIFDTDGNLLITIRGGRFRATDFGLTTSVDSLVYRVEPRIMKSELITADKPLFAMPDQKKLFKRLNNCGLSLDGDENENRLLLDAAAQKLVREICNRLKNANDLIERKSLPENGNSFFNHCILMLEQTGELEDIGNGAYKLVKENELPNFNLLINSVIDEAPEEVASVALLCLSRSVALRILDGEEVEFKPSGALWDHAHFASPQAITRRKVAFEWLSMILSKWSSDRPLKILDLAGSTTEIAHEILTAFPDYTIDICIADAVSSSAARLISGEGQSNIIEIVDVSKGWQDLAGSQFDIVLSSGRLHNFDSHALSLADADQIIAPNALLLAVEPMVDTLTDMQFGLEDNWFTGVIDDFPIGPLKTLEEWECFIQKSGFSKYSCVEKIVDGVSVSMIAGYKETILQVANNDVQDPSEHWTLIVSEDATEQAWAQATRTLLVANGASVETLLIESISAGDDPIFDKKADKNWQTICASNDFANADKRRLVHMAFLSNSDMDLVAQISKRCMSVIGLLKPLESLSCSLAMVTPAGSGMSPDGTNSAVQSAIWAFTRVAVNEAQNIAIKSIDLDINETGAAEKLIHTIRLEENDNEFVFSKEQMICPRIKRGLPNTNKQIAEAVKLTFDNQGVLDDLKWVEATRSEPGPDEIEVEVTATGLNFRDVMWSLGMLPEEALEDGYGGATMGLECSGRVARIGQNVKNVKKGDEVVAFTSSGFANYVKVPSFAVFKLPKGQNLTTAATIPVAFLTAFYSLIHLGDLKKDQWLLLHGAAGGVGLAALQIAKWVGAKVIATAGADEKRELLTTLGADYVLSSRSLEFAQQVREITGDGVHLVLNSLAGEAMERGINALRPFGRFLELGKRDYYGNTKIGLRPFRRNISYFGIDLDQLLLHEQNLAKDMIKQIFKLLNEGTFNSLPHRVFEGENVQNAFRLMQRSGQIGKIIVKPPRLKSVQTPRKLQQLEFSDHGAHVVIGGLGGFGSEIAYWLADHGAKTIILTNRSGILSKTHQDLIDSLAERDVRVLPKICDVTNHRAVETLLIQLRDEMPIKGIIHAAMVIDDGMMTSLTSQKFDTVLAPKVKGAQHINQLTWHDDLDYFILFSSATTLIGNPGQANYVAANGYLEGLARERRQSGRPAIAVGWGAIGDVGFLVRNTETSEKLARHLGDAMMSARKGLNTLTRFMILDDGSVENAVVHIGKFDWSSAHKALPLLKTSMFSSIAASISTNTDTRNQINLIELVAGKDEGEAIDIVSKHLGVEIATILRIPVNEINLKTPLAELGMDSLMGLELRMSVQNRFGLEIPLVAISSTTNLSDVSAQVLKTALASASDTAYAVNADNLALASQHMDVNLAVKTLSKIETLVETEQKKTTDSA